MENLIKTNQTNRLAINKTKITRVRTEITGSGYDFPLPETLMTSSSSKVSNII